MKEAKSVRGPRTSLGHTFLRWFDDADRSGTFPTMWSKALALPSGVDEGGRVLKDKQTEPYAGSFTPETYSEPGTTVWEMFLERREDIIGFREGTVTPISDTHGSGWGEIEGSQRFVWIFKLPHVKIDVVGVMVECSNRYFVANVIGHVGVI